MAKSKCGAAKRRAKAAKQNYTRPDQNTTASSSKPTLLTLPAELRNEIYRLVLVKDGHTQISKFAYAQPALLCTCRQIRREASPMYYKENRFSVEAPNFEFDTYLGFCTRFTPYWRDIQYVILDIHSVGAGNWANLLKGLKAIHEGRIAELKSGSNSAALWKVACKAADIVLKLKGVSWEIVQGVLEDFRVGVTEQANIWQWRNV